MTLTDDEFTKRTAEVLAQESLEPTQWFYLSFAGEEGFRGACIVEANGILSAVLHCNILGINPGGEVMAIPVPEDQVKDIPEGATNVLLSKEKLYQIFDDMKTLEEL
jgi:hypothetical protein